MIARDESKCRLRIALAAFAAREMPAGYGVIGAKFHDMLVQAGAQVLGPTEYGWDCAVAISLPAAWVNPRGAARPDLVWHTMFECTPLPPAWVEVLNRCGLVWVPAQWNADLFRASGVTTPLMVSGYGVNPDVYYPVARAAHDGPFRFRAWGAALVGRKNILTAIRAFTAAGLPEDEAELVVKVNVDMSQAVVKLDGRVLPNVRVIAEDWRYQSQIADWLRAGDCLLYLSAGEGFGLMPLEAMATGLPVILAANTGLLDYANAGNALLVQCPKQVRAVEYEKRFGGVYWQAEPDFDQTVELIRWAFYNRRAAYQVGAQAAQDVQAHWTWAQAGERALAGLTAHYGGGRGN